MATRYRNGVKRMSPRKPTPAEIRETNPNVTKNCDSCEKSMSLDENYGTFENSLTINMSGGYGEYVDTIDPTNQEFEFFLCHKCAHTMMAKFFPHWSFRHWHPKTDDKFCDGWTIDGAFEEHFGA